MEIDFTELYEHGRNDAETGEPMRSNNRHYRDGYTAFLNQARDAAEQVKEMGEME